jgi:hypothetical protein
MSTRAGDFDAPSSITISVAPLLAEQYCSGLFRLAEQW